MFGVTLGGEGPGLIIGEGDHLYFETEFAGFRIRVLVTHRLRIQVNEI